MSELNLPPPPPGNSHHLAMLRNRILTGLLLTIPLAVTVWVVVWAYELATAWAYDWIVAQPFSELFKENGHFSFWFGGLVRFVAMVLLLLFFFLVGDLARYAFFRRGLKSIEGLLLQIPLIKIIYVTCKQIVEAVSKPGGGMFRQVVLFEFPRKGMWAMGFITNEDSGRTGFGATAGQELYSVFYPTTPNPTSGFLIFIPKQDCIPLGISVTDAMRLIISGGAISPASIMHDHRGAEVNAAAELEE